jgi:hydrogenase maturation protease
VTILVAGIGNIFMGDDAFGCEVAKKLAARRLPANVRLVDYGIRGLDLTYALLDDPELTILIDAIYRGGAPGTLYTIEPEVESAAGDAMVDTHSMSPVRVLQAARAMGGGTGRILLVGCEPGDLGGEEGRMGLTPPVAAALDEAANMVEELIHKELSRKEVETYV